MGPSAAAYVLLDTSASLAYEERIKEPKFCVGFAKWLFPRTIVVYLQPIPYTKYQLRGYSTLWNKLV